MKTPTSTRKAGSLRAYAIFVAMLCAALSGGTALADEAPSFHHGSEYYFVVPAQPTTAGQREVAVIEFFSYRSRRSAALRPYMQAWLAEQSGNVIFKRVPIILRHGRLQKIHARAFYTAKALGLLEAIQPAIFNAIHERRQLLRSKEDFQKLFAHFGVSKQLFLKVWNSRAVTRHVKRAAIAAVRYRILNAPTIAIGGKYRTRPALVDSLSSFIDVVDFLVNKRLADKR